MDGRERRRLVGLVLACHVFAGCSYLAPRNIAKGPALDGDEVMFRFYAPTARRVQIGGDWPGNNWARGDGSVGEANVGLMDDKDGDGVWEIRIALRPGRYRYLFLVDENTWHTDPGNVEEVSGGPAQVCSQIVVHMSRDRLEIR
jgi:1,4-alpha-glucan branching enzyme